jgi:hypothetical protein
VIRTVTLNTMDHGPVTFECPSWCIGHGWQPDGQIGRNDIAHNSVRVKAGTETDGHGWVPMLAARISWAPFAELVPVVSVEMFLGHDFSAEEISQVVAGLQTAQRRLERLAAEAIRLRGEIS